MNHANGNGSLDAKIIGIIASLATIPASDIRLEDRLREDLALDSVSSMELLSALAEELDLDIDMEEAMSVTTVAGVIEMAKDRAPTGGA